MPRAPKGQRLKWSPAKTRDDLANFTASNSSLTFFNILVYYFAGKTS